MADLARSADTVVRIGFTFRRAPGVALPRARHLWRAWSHLARRRAVLVRLRERPDGADQLAVQGAPDRALADIGSHVAYLVEFLGGDVQEVSGGRFATAITERPVPLGTVVGHGHAELSDTYEAVENDDYASFSAQFERSVGVVQVSACRPWPPKRSRARGLRRRRRREVGAGAFGEFQLMLNEGAAGTRGFRRVIIGPDQPYFAGGLPMDAPGVGIGQNDGFVFQARAFLEEVAGIDESDSLPRNASFDEGVHNMEILAAVAESAANGGGDDQGSATAGGGGAMKFGVYNAISTTGRYRKRSR